MKIIKHVIVSLLVLFFVTSVLGTVVSPNTDEQKQKLSEQEKMMKLWKEYATPGENHKFLQYFVGEWESIHKFFPEPGGEPFIGKQEISVEMILDGRYLKAHIKKKVPEGKKAPEGLVITGYDNYKKEFIAVSFDNTSTTVYINRGTLDKTGKIRTETGFFDDVLTGKKNKVKAVTTIIDEDHYTYELFDVDESKGKENKVIEVNYTRKK
ncbi:MAG: DUF1579 family protein [Candidatus Aminicenantes bacterium]|nr:MAG: DUF1579 family protein [Candidatus Aminicenantes bacterium]